MPAAWSHEDDLEIFGEDVTKPGMYVVRCLDTPTVCLEHVTTSVVP